MITRRFDIAILIGLIYYKYVLILIEKNEALVNYESLS